MWRTSDFDLIDLPNNYFLVRFLPKSGWAQLYTKVLYEGPWVVQQHSVLVQRWSPSFDPFNNPLGRIVTWIRIPNIPMQCYNRTFITRLGNRIGKTVKVDMLTPSENSSESARVERGKYARICVELDLRKKLVPRVIAANTAYRVEYEGLNLICFECGRYGHRKDSCQWTYVQEKKSEQRLEPQPAIKTGSAGGNSSGGEEAFGSWMIVGRNNRPKPMRKQIPVTERMITTGEVRRGGATVKTSTVSRFSAIAELEEDAVLEKEECRRKSWVPVRVRTADGQLSTSREGYNGQPSLVRGGTGSEEELNETRKEMNGKVQSKGGVRNLTTGCWWGQVLKHWTSRWWIIGEKRSWAKHHWAEIHKEGNWGRNQTSLDRKIRVGRK